MVDKPKDYDTHDNKELVHNADNKLADKGKYSEFYEYILKATNLELSTDSKKAVYLYLAAYECVKKCSGDIFNNAILGLKNAWNIVMSLKNKSLADHIYLILSNHLSMDELKPYTKQLNELVLNKLNDFDVNFDNSDLNEELGNIVNGLKKYMSQENTKASLVQSSAHMDSDNDHNEQSNNHQSAASNAVKKALGDFFDNKSNLNNNLNSSTKTSKHEKDSYVMNRKPLKYADLVGFDRAVSFMKSKGLGLSDNSQYNRLVDQLNKAHGLRRAAFSGSLLFKSPSRDDAKLFMEATAGEIGLPCIHMHLDDSISGASVLTMMAPADSKFKLNVGRTGFNGKGILILEDLDLWDFPDVKFDNLEDSMSSYLSAQMSRGILEVVGLINVALEDPNILVMASMGSNSSTNLIMKLLEADNECVVIDYPDFQERSAIILKLFQDHPSLRAFNVQKLVKYTNNMSRYDIEVSVHEALEDAYRKGIEKKQYVPLTILNIIERFAEHHPLDSDEYKNLEDAATAEFCKDLNNIDELIN